MQVNGGYDVALHVSEDLVQNVINEYYSANPALFSIAHSEALSIPQYGIDQNIFVTGTLGTPIVTIIPGRTFHIAISFNLNTKIQTSIGPTPSGHLVPQPPDLGLQLQGGIEFEVTGLVSGVGTNAYLALDLVNPRLSSFNSTVTSGNVQIGQAGATILQAIIRRLLLSHAATRIVTLPTTWTINKSVPFIGGLQPSVDFKNVENGPSRAVVLLLQATGRPTSWQDVHYALKAPSRVGMSLSFEFLNIDSLV